MEGWMHDFTARKPNSWRGKLGRGGPGYEEASTESAERGRNGLVAILKYFLRRGRRSRIETDNGRS